MPRKEKVWLAIGYVRDTKFITKKKIVASHPKATEMANLWVAENELVLFGLVEIIDNRMEDLMDILIRFISNKNRTRIPYSDSRRVDLRKGGK